MSEAILEIQRNSQVFVESESEYYSKETDVVNILRPRQNHRHYVDIFKHIFMNEIFEYRFIYHQNLFPTIQLTKVSFGSDNGLASCVTRPQWVNDSVVEGGSASTDAILINAH